MCLCAQVKVSSQFQVSSSGMLSISFEKILSLTCSSPIRVDWMACKSKESSYLSFPSTMITTACHWGWRHGWVRVLAALPEDAHSIPSPHVAMAHNCFSLVTGDQMSSSDLHIHCTYVVHRHTCRQSTHIYGTTQHFYMSFGVRTQVLMIAQQTLH